MAFTRFLTAAEKLQFAIGFLERDLSHISETEWPTFRDELRRFFRSPGKKHAILQVRTTGLTQKWPKRFPKRKMLELQREVRQVFQRILSARSKRSNWESEPVASSAVQVDVSVTIGLTYALEEEERRPMLFMGIRKGTTRDLFLVVFFRALSEAGTRAVRRCECGRYFARVRRQKYCNNLECLKRRTKAYWAAYINSPKGVAARKRQYSKWSVDRAGNLAPVSAEVRHLASKRASTRKRST